MTENKRFIYNKFDIVGNFEENELKLYEIDNNPSNDLDESNLFYVYSNSEANIENIVDKLNTLTNENEQLKKENSVFEGKDAKHYQRWVNQIKKYVEEDNPDFTYDEDFIIKIALSYTLQSVRNGESLKRFQWDYKELKSE